MEAKNVRKSPDLPQEIIDIIAHEIVASQNLTLETLKACSLVSRSFFSCCRRLFSDIELVSDTWQTRAGRLVKIFQNPNNFGLAACVRSLTLIFDVPSHNSFMGSKTLGWLHESKMTALTLATKLRLYEDSLIKVLNLLLQASLQSFTLQARRGFLYWDEVEAAESMKKAVFIACIAPFASPISSISTNLSSHASCAPVP